MQPKVKVQDSSLETCPLVSIIIPCYNRSTIIDRAISSVLNQTYSYLEIVIVDDGSEDSEELAHVIDKFEDKRLRLIKHSKNRYQSAASNTGIKAANGDLIAFLDSDDEWLPQKLEKQIKLWNSLLQERVLIYCQSDVRSEPNQSAGEKIWPQRAIALDESIGDYLFLNRGFLQTSSILIPRSVALEVQFDESVRKHTDYNLLLRLESAGISFTMLEESLVIVHWEDLHSTTRGQSPENSIAFLKAYKKYLSSKAATAFCLRQIVYRQLRAGKRLQAWHYLSQFVQLKYLTILDISTLASLWMFKDERFLENLIRLKKKFSWRYLIQHSGIQHSG